MDLATLHPRPPELRLSASNDSMRCAGTLTSTGDVITADREVGFRDPGSV